MRWTPLLPTRLVFLLLLAIGVAGCRTPGKPAVEEETPPVEIVLPPTTTRGEFTIEADKLDTWNAVGQIAVRTPGVEYEGRAQMMDLYALRYRDVDFLVLTKALPTSETIKRLTTKVTATTPGGKPIDSDAVAELLALFQRDLPAEIGIVRATQAAEKKAAEKKAKSKGKAKKKKKK
jgi:hypothetical protein